MQSCLHVPARRIPATLVFSALCPCSQFTPWATCPHHPPDAARDSVRALEKKPKSAAAQDRALADVPTACLTTPFVEAASYSNRTSCTALAQAWVAYLTASRPSVEEQVGAGGHRLAGRRERALGRVLGGSQCWPGHQVFVQLYYRFYIHSIAACCMPPPLPLCRPLLSWRCAW